MRVLSIFVLMLSSPWTTTAQFNKLDSMELKLQQKGIAVNEQLRLCDDLSWGYLDQDFAKSSQFAREGIRLARKADNREMEATLLRNLGVAYYMDNRLDSAEVILIEALQIARNGEDTSVIAAVHTALGNLYNVQGRYDKAVENYTYALPIYEKIGRIDRVYTIQSNIGALYSSRGNYSQAEKYLLAAHASASNHNDIVMMGRIAQNLSNIYFATSRADEAFRYAEEAVSYCREAGDDYNEVLALTSLSGACHIHLKDNRKAMQYAVEALDKARQIGMPSVLSAAQRNITYAYYRIGDYVRAREAALACLELTDSTDLSQRLAMNSSLVEIYIHTGEKERAETAFHTVYELMTRQSDEQIASALSEMEVKYDTERKESRIEMLSHDRQLFIGLTVAGGAAALLLIVVIILMNRYQRQRRLRMEEQLKVAEQEKQLMAAQSLLDGENQERGRLARELHDGLGGMLTMIKMSLGQMKTQTSVDFDRVLGFVDNSINEMRKMAHNIMPESILKFGLVPTLTEFCKNIPNLNLHVYGNALRYSDKIEVNFYRIACELINNALKHADATTINVQLIASADKLSLSVQDNGCGFTLEKHPNALQTVKSRVEILNASIDIFTREGGGTEVTVELNIEGHD